MTFDDAVARASKGTLKPADFSALCDATGGDRTGALDVIALELAQRYLAGTIDYPVADNIANYLFAYAATIRELPNFMVSIFQAFDAGEFVPPKDPAGTNPELKYTRPQIVAALARRGTAS